MPSDRLVRDSEKSLMRTIAALDTGLLADSLNPFIGADRLVARLASPSTFKAAWVDVIAAIAKEGAEQCDLRFRRRSMTNRLVVLNMDCELSSNHRPAHTASEFIGPEDDPSLRSLPRSRSRNMSQCQHAGNAPARFQSARCCRPRLDLPSSTVAHIPPNELHLHSDAPPEQCRNSMVEMFVFPTSDPIEEKP